MENKIQKIGPYTLSREEIAFFYIIDSSRCNNFYDYEDDVYVPRIDNVSNTIVESYSEVIPLHSKLYI